MGKHWQTLLLGAPISLQMVTKPWIERCFLLGRKVMTNLDNIVKIRDITLPTKICLVKAMVFPVGMSGCESWTIKNWCFRAVVLEQTLQSPLDFGEIQPVQPRGNQSWIFIVEAETPILWPPDVMNWLIWKDPDVGKDWWREDKGMTEDDLVVWHHWNNGHEFEYTPGVGDGQGGLEWYSPWGHKELDINEQMNGTELFVKTHGIRIFIYFSEIYVFDYSGSFLLHLGFFSCCEQGLFSHCGVQASYWRE